MIDNDADEGESSETSEKNSEGPRKRRKKAKSTSEKSQRFRCGDNPDFFPRILLVVFVIKIIDN